MTDTTIDRPVIRDWEITKPSYRVENRSRPCNCGCNGHDPWHRTHYVRRVRNIVVLDAPESVMTRPYGLEEIVARGVADHPSMGKNTPVGLLKLSRFWVYLRVEG